MRNFFSALFAGGLTFICCSHVSAAQAGQYTEKVLYSFKGSPYDGYDPAAGLISVNGNLYGTTSGGGQYGGTYGFGTAFVLDPQNGTEKVLWSFGNGTDGISPVAGLISVGGKLYGTTGGGGQYSGGTVFSLDPNTGSEQVLWSFGNGTDGRGPAAGLISIHGLLYGTTEGGGKYGQYGDGTVFSLDPKTGSEKTLWSFGNGTDGIAPAAGLIFLKGSLYGTTEYGGPYDCGPGCGTVFALDPKTDTEKVVWSFDPGAADGVFPVAGLISIEGRLYGTTWQGGGHSLGAVFALDPISGAERVFWGFRGSPDGDWPLAGLISVNGTFYGTTAYGGRYGQYDGAVFSFDPTTGAEKVLWSFGNGTDGKGPAASLISVNGTFYGTTSYGGKYDYGTLFSLEPR